MERRRINWKAVVVFLLFMVILGVTVVGLRLWRKNLTAKNSLRTGLTAYDTRQWRQAARELGRYLAANPKDIAALQKYAEARLRVRPLKRDDLQQAIAAYRNILREDPQMATATEDLIDLYLQLEISSEAELIARQYLKTNDAPDIAVQLAMALTRQREFSEAADVLLDLIQRHPQTTAAYEILAAIAELQPGVLTEPAQHWHDLSIANNPLSAEALLGRAAYHLRHNRIDDALTDLQLAEQQDLSEPAVRLRLAEQLLAARQYDQARIHLTLLEPVDPQNLVLWKTWAAVALAAESPREMQTVADRGLKALEPDYWDFVPIAGELYIRSGQYDRAAEWIQKLSENDFDPATRYKMQGLLADNQRDYFSAIRCWTQAHEAGDTSETTYFSLARAYLAIGDTESSVSWLRQLIAEHPDSLQGRLELARVLSQAGRWEEAAELTRRAVQLAPANVDALLLQIRSQIQLADGDDSGSNAILLNRLQTQLYELEQAYPELWTVTSVQIELALRRQRFDEAQQYLEKLKTQLPDDPQTTLAECELLIARDDIPQAIDRLKALTEQYPNEILAVEYLAYLLARQDERAACENLLLATIQRIDDAAAKRRLGLFMANLQTHWQQPEKAYTLLTELAEQMPLDIPVKRQLLKQPRVTADAATAQRIIDRIKEIEGPQGWQWRYEQAKVWYAATDFNDRYPRIVTVLKENLAFNPSDQQSRLLLAATYEKANNVQLAMATCKEALNRTPDDMTVMIPAVEMMYRAGEYEAAEQIMNRIANQKQIVPALARLEFESHLRQGNLQSAETLIENLHTENPEDAGVSLSLALLQIRLEKYDRALEVLNTLRTAQPDSLPAAAALAELNVRQNKFEEALRICDEQVEKHATATAYILRGQTLLAAGQTEPAQQDFQRAAAREPDNPQAWLASSQFHQNTGNYQQAVADMQKALNLAPDDLEIQKRMIALLLASNRPAEVRQPLEQLINKAQASSPADMELKLYEARCLLLYQEPAATENARRILLTVTEENPRNVIGWILLANIHLDQAQLGRAMDTMLQALTYLPEDDRLLLMKARIEARRSPAAALPTLEFLYARQPENIEIVLELARTHTTAQQYDKSIELLNAWLEKYPDGDNKRVNIQLAMALYKDGQVEKAQQLFESLYAAGPDDPAVLLAEADLWIEARQWEPLEKRLAELFERNTLQEQTADALITKLLTAPDASALQIAERLIHTMLRQQPNSPRANKALAILYQIKGMPSKSAEIYEQVLHTSPEDLVALNNLAWILCEQQSNYPKALELAERGLTQAPDYADLIDTRGVIYYRMADYQKAARDFSRCIELYPENSASNSVARFHLARSLAALGQADRAVQHMNQSLDANKRYGGLSGAEVAEARQLLEKFSQSEQVSDTYQ